MCGEKKWEWKALTCALLHILKLIVKFGSLHSGDALCHELVRLVQLLLKPRERKGRHLEWFLVRPEKTWKTFKKSKIEFDWNRFHRLDRFKNKYKLSWFYIREFFYLNIKITI